MTAPAPALPATRRLRRTERRDQILAAATRAFARAGFAATSLEDIAAEAGISRVILYRHFDSKTDLYRAVLERAMARIATAVGSDQTYTSQTVESLLAAAGDDPDGFRLLFHYAAREPEFRADVDRIRADSVRVAQSYLQHEIDDAAWATWASHLAPSVAIEAVIAWLDAGQPDRGRAANAIRRVLGAVVSAAGRDALRRGTVA